MTVDVAPSVATAAQSEPMLPVPYRVAERWVETHDSVTLRLEPLAERLPAFRPGQFTMLYAHGIGEIAISVSGDPSVVDGSFTQTIRDVGAVSAAITRSAPGDVLGVRGPYGADWGIGNAAEQDLIIVAGGVGLAPLRPVVLGALADRARYRRVVLIAGARTPSEFLFRDQLATWTSQAAIEVEQTVDRPAVDWNGPVGFVTEPLGRLAVDPQRTIAFLCGPEPMMRFSANVLLGKGVAPGRIRVSLERDMKCGIGLCGHCQLGPLLVCRDGPVVDYSTAQPLLATREL